jgi:hypothetical protein
MANVDSTPQLKLAYELADVHASRDAKNFEPFLSKDFMFRTFPETAELPDLTKEEFLQVWGEIFSVLSKVEVRIQHSEISFDFP